MSEFQIYFKVALIPAGEKYQHNYNNDDDDYIFEEIRKKFNTYLCTHEQSSYVLKELNEIYDGLKDDTITKLRYMNDGKFTCVVTLQHKQWCDNELYDYIEELLWPADIHDTHYMFINSKQYSLDLDVTYISDWLDIEEANEMENEEDDE